MKHQYKSPPPSGVETLGRQAERHDWKPCLLRRPSPRSITGSQALRRPTSKGVCPLDLPDCRRRPSEQVAFVGTPRPECRQHQKYRLRQDRYPIQDCGWSASLRLRRRILSTSSHWTIRRARYSPRPHRAGTSRTDSHDSRSLLAGPISLLAVRPAPRVPSKPLRRNVVTGSLS